MRTLTVALAATLLCAASQSLQGQQISGNLQVSTASAMDDSVETALRALDLVEGELSIQGALRRGDFTLAAGDTVRGPLVVLRGNANVEGTVLGNVTAVFGDVTVRDGADVHGSATAWRGRVIVEGGRVRGAIGARPVAAARRPAPPMPRAEALKLSGGWTAMLLIIGLAALALVGRNLDGTARALADDFGRAFFVGVAGQLGFLPLLLLVVAALAVTLVGILLIPFALVAAPVAFGGLLTLGWLAMAMVLGKALLRLGAANDRGALLKALVLGVLVLMAPWVLAAALQGTGALVMVVRGAALGITWAAATAGLGAALLSRAGTARQGKPATVAATSATSAAAWQTPTPVVGVAAARRPVPARPATKGD